MTARILLPAAAVAFATGLSACGGFDSAASGESLIRDYIKQNTTPGSKPTNEKISCPSGVAQKTGGTYECKLSATIATGASATPVSGTVTIHMIAGNKVEVQGKSDFHLH